MPSAFAQNDLTYKFTLGSPLELVHGIAIDSSDNLIVADGSYKRVVKFNQSGTFLGNIDANSSGKFTNPIGVAVDSKGNFYVADTNNNQLEAFDRNGVLLWKVGNSGSGNGQFNSPTYVAIDSSSNVFVIDSGNYRIQKFDKDGGYVSKFGGHGLGDGQFTTPNGIAIDTTGNVYITDGGQALSTYVGRVLKFNNAGKYQSTFGTAGTDHGQLNFPSAITVDSDGTIYVADGVGSGYGNLSNHHRIQKFDNAGKFQLQFSSDGIGDDQITHPGGMAIDSAGNVYISDFQSYYSSPHVGRVEKFDRNGNYIRQYNNVTKAPARTACDSKGNIYVTDTYNDCIQKYDNAGRYLTHFGSLGSGDVQFNNPNGIVLDKADNIYVADTNNHRIEILDKDGTYIAEFGSNGTGNKQFNLPQGIALDSQGNIYVADTGNNRIQKFDTNFSYKGQAGTPGVTTGLFNTPSDICIDSKDAVYITDTGNHRIQKFDKDLNYQTQFGAHGSGNGLFARPDGISVDSGGNIYVADTQDTSNFGTRYINNRIQKFNKQLQYQGQFGVTGTSNGQFSSPGGVYVDQTGRVYVADTGNDRVQVFAPNTVPAPSLASISPASISAGSSDTGLVLNGANFTATPTVTFGDTTLTPNFLSVAKLAVLVPSRLLTTQGTVSVTVKNPDGQVSNSVPVTITAAPPKLSILRTTAPTFARTTNGITVTITIANSGPSAATNVKLVGARLKSSATITTLPITYASIGGNGATKTVTFTFPVNAVPSGVTAAYFYLDFTSENAGRGTFCVRVTGN